MDVIIEKVFLHRDQRDLVTRIIAPCTCFISKYVKNVFNCVKNWTGIYTVKLCKIGRELCKIDTESSIRFQRPYETPKKFP